MFCPRCAAENELQQSYCRQCGQALSDVRLALEGNAEQSLEKLRAGQKWIGGGSASLLAFTSIALVIAILGVALHDLSFGYIAFINLILGSFIGLPLVYFGKAKVKRAGLLLSKYQGESHTHSALNKAQQSGRSLTTGSQSRFVPTAQSKFRYGAHYH